MTSPTKLTSTDKQIEVQYDTQTEKAVIIAHGIMFNVDLNLGSFVMVRSIEPDVPVGFPTNIIEALEIAIRLTEQED
jgi:hypothetical protein